MMKTYKEWFAQYMEEFRRDHPDSAAPNNSMLSDFYDKYVREFKTAEKAKIKLTFVNTDEFTQIDWDTEIADEVPVHDDGAIRAGDAVQVWVIANDHFDTMDTEDPVSRANLLRILEYLYAKFRYHHAYFYVDYNKGTIDVAKEIREDKEHPLNRLREKFSTTVRSTLPIEKAKELEAMFTEIVHRERAERLKLGGGYAEAKEMFEKEGLEIIKPRGIKEREGDRDTVCTVHDGVFYHLYLMKQSGPRDQEFAKKEADAHKEMIARYHPLVKDLYERIEKIDGVGRIWAMEGGGMQCQVFFGNKSGYLAILYLDMKGGNFKKKPNHHNFKLVVNFPEQNAQYFKDFVTPDGVELIINP